MDNGASIAAEPADLVIMNPPFTRDSLRHDQFDAATERKIKDREKTLLTDKPVHLSSNGNAFLVLADCVSKPDSGTIAAVLALPGLRRDDGTTSVAARQLGEYGCRGRWVKLLSESE